MSTTEQQPKNAKPRRRLRRWLIALAILLVIVLIVVEVAERVLDVDRHRASVIASIERSTGLPATIGRLELAFLPTPRVEVHDVAVGEGDFKALADKVSIYFEPTALFQRTAHVTDVIIKDLEVTFPEAMPETSDRFQAMGRDDDEEEAAGEEEGEPEGGGFTVVLDQIRTKRGRLYLAGREGEALVADVTVTNPITDEIGAAFKGRMPRYGVEALVDGILTIARPGVDGTSASVTGEVRLEDIAADTLVQIPDMPPALLDGVVVVNAPSGSRIELGIDGSATPVAKGPVDLRSLASTFTGHAVVEDGTVSFDQWQWTSDGVALTAEGSWTASDDWAVRVPTLEVSAVGIETLLALNPPGSFSVRVDPDARLEGTDLVVGKTPGGLMAVSDGSARFQGVHLTVTDGSAAFSDIQGSLVAREGVFTLTELTSPGLALRGTLIPNLDDQSVRVDLAGDVKLTRERFAGFVSTDAVSDLGGTIRLDHVRGTFPAPEGGLPTDFSIEGTLQDGRVVVATENWQDRVEPLRIDFRAVPDAVETRVEAQSERLGRVVSSGRYRVSAAEWTGDVRADLAAMALPLPTDGAAAEIAPELLAAYGQSSFNVAVALPSAKTRDIRITAVRDAAPAADIALTLARPAGEPDASYALGALDVKTDVPIAVLAKASPANLSGDGNARVRVLRPGDAPAFSVAADLTACQVDVGQHVSKQPGDSTTVDVRGAITADGWTPRTVHVKCLTQAIEGRFDGDRFRIDNLNLDLGRMTPLFHGGLQAGGQVRGTLATSPLELRLDLANARVPLSPEAGIDQASGVVSCRGDVWNVTGLSVNGANSRVVVNATGRGSRWEGAIKGEQLDIDGVSALVEAVNTLLGESDETPEVGAPAVAAARGEDRPFTAEFAVEVQRLLYRRAQASNVLAQVHVNDTGVTADILELRPYTGSATGVIRIASSKGEQPGFVDVDLKLAGIDARFIDELAFETTRNLTGALTGDVKLRVPIAGGPDAYRGAQGSMVFTGKNGSLGTLGLATKLLTVYRATEITRLRLPSLRDEGLVYDLCQGKAVMTNGVLNVEHFKLQGASYLIGMTGSVDFPESEMNLLVNFNALETVSSLADYVPVVGKTVQDITKLGGITFLAHGPPEDPKVTLVAGPVENIAGEVTDGAKTGQEIVIEELKGLAAEALRNILK
ncbi:MAG: AsmA-like C-terminal region-containing protein [bacterium]|nr:AsmA-like C-terminal region-containing protein [bacterium]